MTAPRRKPGCLARTLRRFARRDDGATAVEFALIALPFLSILFAIFQIGAVFFAQQVLQTATTQAARLIMTGQAQTQGMTAAQFAQQVCNNTHGMFTCSGLNVNVQTFSSFSGMSQLNPLNNGTLNKTSMSYTTGGIGNIMLVQVFYQWPVYIGPLGFTMANMSGNYRLLTATAVFRNEPY